MANEPVILNVYDMVRHANLTCVLQRGPPPTGQKDWLCPLASVCRAAKVPVRLLSPLNRFSGASLSRFQTFVLLLLFRSGLPVGGGTATPFTSAMCVL